MLRSDYNKGIVRLAPTVCPLCAVAEIGGLMLLNWILVMFRSVKRLRLQPLN